MFSFLFWSLQVKFGSPPKPHNLLGIENSQILMIHSKTLNSIHVIQIERIGIISIPDSDLFLPNSLDFGRRTGSLVTSEILNVDSKLKYFNFLQKYYYTKIILHMFFQLFTKKKHQHMISHQLIITLSKQKVASQHCILSFPQYKLQSIRNAVN